MLGIQKTARKPGHVELVSNLPSPKIKMGEVLVKVEAASICGSDLHGFNFDEGYKDFMQVPVIMGHETAGQVVDIDDSVKRFKIGDRVFVEPFRYCGKCKQCRTGRTNICENYKVMGFTVDGAFCEYLAVDEKYLHKIPPQIDYKEGALVEPSAVALHGLKMGGMFPGAKVIVFGPGIIGFLSALIAKEIGAGRVLLVGRNNARLPLAQKIGLETINTQEENINQFEGEFDILVECSGNNKVIEEHLNLLNKGGNAVLVGIYKDIASIYFTTFIRKEINIISSYASTWSDYEQIINMLSNGRLNLKMLYDVYSFSNFKKAFNNLIDRKVLKPVMVPPWS